MYVNGVLPNSQCLQREVMWFGGILGPFRCFSWPKSVGKLGNCKNTCACLPR